MSSPTSAASMHPNGVLLQRLFAALNRHDHSAMTACYHPEATFHDIAFDLIGRDRIGQMWRMICKGDIKATVDGIQADDKNGRTNLVDTYSFGEKKLPVRNVIESRFKFQDGLIIEQRDSCDARGWAKQAVGGVPGFLAGRIHFLRSLMANKKLDKFIRDFPNS